MTDLVLILHDIRSTHNVGSILRSSDGFGVARVVMTGYTPYPMGDPNDTRLPHIREKLHAQISKTALGAESSVVWEHNENIISVLNNLKDQGYTLAALEQSVASVPLNAYSPPQKLALLVGREVEGIDDELLKLCDITLEIPMQGSKESFNVSVATAVAIYQLLIKS